MTGLARTDAIKGSNLFNGLGDPELDEVAKISKETSFAAGQVCQDENRVTNLVHLIVKGKVGSVARIPNVTSPANEIVVEVLRDGDVFGWSSLIKGTSTWPALRALEPVDALYINAGELLQLCEHNSRIGYIVMRNLSTIIAARLRRNRMSILNAITAIKGEY